MGDGCDACGDTTLDRLDRFVTCCINLGVQPADTFP
jgi:hypothetical protein